MIHVGYAPSGPETKKSGPRSRTRGGEVNSIPTTSQHSTLGLLGIRDALMVIQLFHFTGGILTGCST